MQTKFNQKALIIGTAVLMLVAGAAVAFAHGGPWGDDYDGYGMMGYGRGYGMGPGMMGYGPGYYGMGPGMMGYGRYDRYDRDDRPNLTQEQRDQLDAAQEKFWTENRKLRDQIADKRDELNAELSKDNVNEGKVTALQKDISKLRETFDQKLVQHQLELRKIAPDYFNDRGYGRGRGYGPGYCWR